MTYVHRNVKRRMALEGVKRHTRFSTYSWWRPGVYLALIIVDCGQGNIVALFGLKKSGKDIRPQRLQVGLSLTDPHAIGSLLGCNHIFATSFSWVQTLVPSMLSRWPWCHFYFILFFILFVVTKMTSMAFWSAMVDGVGDEPRGLYCLLTIAARRFGWHRIGSRSIEDRSSYTWRTLVPTDGVNWWCVNFHHQLYSQVESSILAKKKTIIEDPTGVGLGGEALMLKLAKNLAISQIKRDFS